MNENQAIVNDLEAVNRQLRRLVDIMRDLEDAIPATQQITSEFSVRDALLIWQRGYSAVEKLQNLLPDFYQVTDQERTPNEFLEMLRKEHPSLREPSSIRDTHSWFSVSWDSIKNLQHDRLV